MNTEQIATYGAMLITLEDSSISLENDSSAINILSNSGQMIGAYFSRLPGATVAVAPMAATITIGKIAIDAKNEQKISVGDILGVTGNAVAIIAAVGALAGVTTVAAPAAVIGLALAGLGALSDTEYGAVFTEKIHQTMADAIYRLAEKSVSESLITDLQSRFQTALTTVSPLILDLDHDGIETLSTSQAIHFDHNGNRFAETTGWVAPDDGLLVWDRNGNGVIDDGSELFGNYTASADGSRAANGFIALAALDNNGDGKIDAADAAFGQLRVWKDADSNATVSNGELLTLDAAGVQSLNLAYVGQSLTDAQGNQLLQTGSYVGSDGATHAMVDAWFATDTARTLDLTDTPIDDAIADLPDLPGFGNVPIPHQAMARDGRVRAAARRQQPAVGQLSNRSGAGAYRQLEVSLRSHCLVSRRY